MNFMRFSSVFASGIAKKSLTVRHVRSRTKAAEAGKSLFGPRCVLRDDFAGNPARKRR